MRLTKVMQQAFVRAAMNDVPRIDYQELIRSEVNKKVASLHKKAKIVDIDPLRFDRQYIHLGSQSIYVNGILPSEIESIKNDPKILEYKELNTVQSKKINALNQSLTGAISGCTTRKQAVEAFPEFEKYLPEDAGKAIRSVPALANILSDFVKAGWPKDMKRVTV